MAETGFAVKALVTHTPGPPTVLGLPLGLKTFCDKAVAGGDADEGPNVRERERDEARTEPMPEPLRGCDCWSGEAAIAMFWVHVFRSAARGPARVARGGVVPVEYGGVESGRQISDEERPELWVMGVAWLSFGVEASGTAVCGLLCVTELGEYKSNENACSSIRLEAARLT